MSVSNQQKKIMFAGLTTTAEKNILNYWCIFADSVSQKKSHIEGLFAFSHLDLYLL